MSFWGLPPIHPQTFAMADEVAHTAVMVARAFGLVYKIMLKTAVDDLILVVRYSK